ncbi:type II toxin-antitoxin system PemK/MazF family toxin [Pacificimonas sp. ICDLI1SI03]
MALRYYPSAGEILSCDYSTGFTQPEMVKVRPVVVMGPRLRRREGLVGVVPLSTSAPTTVEPYHRQITLSRPLPPPFDNATMWAKCDMFAVVARARLDRFRLPRSRLDGQRQWVNGRITAAQLQDLRAGLLCGLGFDSLTVHL